MLKTKIDKKKGVRVFEDPTNLIYGKNIIFRAEI